MSSETLENGLAQAVMQAAVDAIIVIDRNGSILRFSDSARTLFEYGPDEVLGQNVSLLMPEPHARAHDQYLTRYLKTGTPQVIGYGRCVSGRK